MKVMKVAALVLCVVLIGVSIAFPEDKAGAGKADQEQLYREAMAKREDGDWNGAQYIFGKLIAENPGTPKYEVGYVDALLDQSQVLKDERNPLWKVKAKEAATRIKAIRAANSANADYWVTYARYSTIIEANKEGHVTKALEQAFYFKPGHPEAFIVRGDFLFQKAQEASTDGQQHGMVKGVASGDASDRRTHAVAARSAYESALSGNLSDKRKAYVHLRMGDIEENFLLNKDAAKSHWQKALSLAPDSPAGKKARVRLGQ